MSAVAATAFPAAAAGASAAAASGTGQPTNGRLYYFSQVPPTTSGYDSAAPDGSNVQAESKVPIIENGAAWSPDGSKFAFGATGYVYVTDPAFTTATEIMVSKPVNNVGFYDPHWLPDGSGLAYSGFDSSTNTTAIWTGKADGTGQTKLAVPGALSTTGGTETFAVLPDGDYVIAETTSATKMEVDLWHPGSSTVTPLVQNIPTGGLTTIVANPDGDATLHLVDPANKAAGWTVEDVNVTTKTVKPIATGVDQHPPMWSPDGTKLSYSLLDPTPSGAAISSSHLVIEDIASKAVTTVVPKNTTLANYFSYPVAWRPVPATTPPPPPAGRTQVDRVAGTERVGTSIATSQLGFNATGGGGRQAASAVLSRSDNYFDALAGGALAAHKKGPLLLTPTASLDPRVGAELRRILPTGATVYLLGGTSALSDQVLHDVAALGFTPVRVAGPDRFATAVAAAQQSTPTPHQFLVATGLNFPDALAAGAAAGANPDAVVLLSSDNTLPTVATNYLTANRHSGDTILGVGNQGSNALASVLPSTAITSQLRGHDRFDTATQLANFYYSALGAPKTVGVATAYNWPDALGGGALLGAHPGPLLLVDPKTGLSTGETSYLTANSSGVGEIVVFGGTAVVPQAIEDSVATTAKGAGNFDEQLNRTAPAMP